MQLGDHGLAAIWLSEKDAVRRQIGWSQPKLARSDEDLYRRPSIAHLVSQLQSVHASGHVDIREQHGDIRTSLQQGNGFVGITSFQRYETCLLDEFDGQLAQKKLILYD